MNSAQSLEEKYQEALRALEEILKIPIETSTHDRTEKSETSEGMGGTTLDCINWSLVDTH